MDGEPQEAMELMSISESAQTGDLIFRRGRDLVASAVLNHSTDSRFSHVGVVVREGEAVSVVHAEPGGPDEPGGVIQEPLARFAAPDRASTIGVFRLGSLTPQSREAMRQYAVSQLGKPFDMRLRLSDSTEHYCTELVIKALEASGLRVTNVLEPVQVMLMEEPAVAPTELLKLPGLHELGLK